MALTLLGQVVVFCVPVSDERLPGFGRVVIIDPSWNPAHDLQAQDRAFRIGQVQPALAMCACAYVCVRMLWMCVYMCPCMHTCVCMYMRACVLQLNNSSAPRTMVHDSLCL